MTKNALKKLLMALLVMILCVNAFATKVNAATTYTMNLKVTYSQTEARSMLSLVNEFRTGDDAWYWNSTDTEKVTVSGLSELTYDYRLEEQAMLRAAEVAIYASHTRPDTTSCWTAYSDDSVLARAENIAWGYTTAEDAFTAWLEADDDYSGQGHRRNMLANATSIGIGHVIYKGTDMWVMVVGKSLDESTNVVTTANDSETVVPITVDSSIIESSSLTTTATTLSVEAGSTVSLPSYKAYFNGYTATVDIDWASSDASVAAVEDGVIVGKSLGCATITGTYLSHTISVDVYVSQTVTTGGKTYSMEASSSGTITATLTGVSSKKIKSASINTVTVNGKSYKVTEIAEGAFKNCKKLKTVTIGSNVKTIGDSAFSGCTKLKTVKGCKKVTYIGASAFYNCKKLTAVAGCTKVITIGDSAFENCVKLTTLGNKKKVITLPKVKTIGDSAFYSCSNITYVNATSKALTTISGAAFCSCVKLKKAVFKSKKLKTIGRMAFTSDVSLKNVTFKTTKLKSSKIGELAFWGVNNCTFKVPKSKISAYKKLLINAGADSTIKVVKK